MRPPWVARRSCGWIAAAETAEEAGAVLEIHKVDALPGRQHLVTIEGAVVPGRTPASPPRAEPGW